MKIGRKVLTTAIAALCLVGVGAGIAWASIPGPDGVIHGCRKNTDGSLRAIDSAATCPSGWTELNWNQTGPQGPAGTVPTPITVTQVVRHTPTDGTFIPETVTCPSGKHAINGGVLQAQAVGWPGGSQYGWANAASGFEVPSPSDPTVSLSLPRPVNGETGWRVLDAIGYPVAAGVQYDIDVTLFATCI